MSVVSYELPLERELSAPLSSDERRLIMAHARGLLREVTTRTDLVLELPTVRRNLLFAADIENDRAFGGWTCVSHDRKEGGSRLYFARRSTPQPHAVPRLDFRVRR